MNVNVCCIEMPTSFHFISTRISHLASVEECGVEHLSADDDGHHHHDAGGEMMMMVMMMLMMFKMVMMIIIMMLVIIMLSVMR